MVLGIVTKAVIAKKTGKAVRRATKAAVKELGGKKKAKKATRAAASAAVDELTSGLVDLGGTKAKSKKKKQTQKNSSKTKPGKSGKKAKRKG